MRSTLSFNHFYPMILLFTTIMVTSYFIIYLEFFINPQITNAQINVIEVKPIEKAISTVDQNHSLQSKFDKISYQVNPTIHPILQQVLPINATDLNHQNNIMIYETNSKSKKIQQILYYNYNIPETSLLEFTQSNITGLSSVTYYTNFVHTPPFHEYNLGKQFTTEQSYKGIKQQQYNNFLIEHSISLAKPEINYTNILNETNNFSILKTK